MPPTFLDTFIPSKKSLRSWLTGIYWNLVKLNLIDTLFIKRNKPFFHWFVEDVFWLYFAFSLDLKKFWIHKMFQSEIGFVTPFLFFSTIVQCYLLPKCHSQLTNFFGCPIVTLSHNSHRSWRHKSWEAHRQKKAGAKNSHLPLFHSFLGRKMGPWEQRLKF